MTDGSLEEARQRGGMETELVDVKVRGDLYACLRLRQVLICLPPSASRGSKGSRVIESATSEGR